MPRLARQGNKVYFSVLLLTFALSAKADLFDIKFISEGITVGSGQFGTDGTCAACRKGSGLTSFVATFMRDRTLNEDDGFDDIVFVRANTTLNGNLELMDQTHSYLRLFRNDRFLDGPNEGAYVITPAAFVLPTTEQPITPATIRSAVPEPRSLTLIATICAFLGVQLRKRLLRPESHDVSGGSGLCEQRQG